MLYKKLIVGLLMATTITQTALTANIQSTETENGLKIISVEQTDVTLGDAFIAFGKIYQPYTPKTYRYIELQYTGLENNSQAEEALQILVYHDKFTNKKVKLPLDYKLNAFVFYKLAEKVLDIEVNMLDITSLKNRKANEYDVKNVANIFNSQLEQNIELGDGSAEFQQKKAIFNDVYKSILEHHYDKKTISKEQLIEKATQGLARGSGDKHTVYFPPTESKDFMENLDGNFEGIGAYVDMPEPGVFVITAPVSGGPAEAAGIVGGDRVIEVDGKKVTEKNDLNEIVHWIKGAAGTRVKLKIIREKKVLEIEVERGKVVIKNLEHKKINNTSYLIQIKNFGSNVSMEYKQALEVLKKEQGIKKVILDFRNNGGGYLHEVNTMLDYNLRKGENTAVVRELGNTIVHQSMIDPTLTFDDYKVIILQNQGTASASEIMIGTLKDYYPVTIVGTQSYGKGSVQTIKQYIDGSSLKYTIAKWFTGKSETAIDGIGITPDIQLELNVEDFINNKKDNQMEKALSL